MGVRSCRVGLGQVGGFAVADAPFAGRKGEQCLQREFLLLAGFEEFLAGGAPPLSGRPRVARPWAGQPVTRTVSVPVRGYGAPAHS